jgi:hypothetical protein
VLLLGFGHSVGTVPITPKGAFFKYYSIAFSILPSIAGGLALDLNDCKINELSPRLNQALSFLENLRRQNPKKLVCYHAVIGFSFKH